MTKVESHYVTHFSDSVFEVGEDKVRLIKDNKDYIGISNDRLFHMLGVARQCYDIAKKMGFDESFCRKMFIIGFNHDIGYEFSKNKNEHPTISSNMLESLGTIDENSLLAIKEHGDFPSIDSIEWKILNLADMTIDSKGHKVNIEQRLEDIENRYGKNSNTYILAKKISIKLKGE